MPLVVLSALKDEQVAMQSLQEGAQDYLVKAELDSRLLWRALRYAMERQRLQLDLRNLSLIDDLTGLNNRKGFLCLARHHVKLAARTGASFLVGFIDLDGMKEINDTHGHQEGNRALVETANILRDSFRQSDILGRFGGDEFVALVTDTDISVVPIVKKRILEKTRSRNVHPERRYLLSLSIGLVGSASVAPPDLEQLLQLADAEMYRDKREKRAAVLSATEGARVAS
jgi:diguanylate cyclase (GGDEF)-like protein